MALWCVIVILFTFRCANLDVTKIFNAFSLTAWDSSRFLFQPVTVSLKLYNYPAAAIPDMFLTRQHSAIATMRLFCWQLRPMSASILRHAPRLCPPDAELILKVLSAPVHGGLVCIYGWAGYGNTSGAILGRRTCISQLFLFQQGTWVLTPDIPGFGRVFMGQFRDVETVPRWSSTSCRALGGWKTRSVALFSAPGLEILRCSRDVGLVWIGRPCNPLDCHYNGSWNPNES